MSDLEEGSTGDYLQLFVYLVPRSNHGAMADAQGKLAKIFKEHGMARSEFFQLSSTETFKGFASLASIISAGPEEEVWLEIEHYKDSRDRDDVVAKIGKDERAGRLFRQVLSLVTPGSVSLQGDFSQLKV